MSARGRQRKIIALDWDTRTLRVVHAQVGKRGVTIDRLLAADIPADLDTSNPQELGQHIRRVLDQEGIATRQAIVDIPRDQAILNTLTLPTTAPDELPGMVQIQIAKELPFPVADAAVDFALESDQEGKALGEVLVAAVRREFLEQYTATIQAAGLKLERVGLRPYSSKVAVCRLLQHAMPERVLFVDIGPTLTEINVLRHSALAFSRAASVLIPHKIDEHPSLTIHYDDAVAGETVDELYETGVGSVTVDDVIQTLVAEVTRSIEAYRGADPGATIDHVVIGGDSGVEERLAEAIQKRLGITTEIFNPAATFGWEPDEGAGAAAYAASLGLILAQTVDPPLHIDFLSPKKTVSQREKRLRKVPLVAAVVALFLASGVIGFSEMYRPKRDELARINKRIEELAGQKKEFKAFLKFMKEPSAYGKQHVWVDVLYDVIQSLPPYEELVLDRVTMDQKNSRVDLKARWKSRDEPMRTVDRLHTYRRSGRDQPRFDVTLGTFAEKPERRYPFEQDLRIKILDDQAKRSSKKGRS